MPDFAIHGGVLGLFLISIWVFCAWVSSGDFNLRWGRVALGAAMLQVICISGAYLASVGVF